MDQMQLTMRHLGLVPYREGAGKGDFDTRIRTITDMIGQYVDLDRLLALMKDADVPVRAAPSFEPTQETEVTIGVAYDEAFNFYYADLFDVLASLGAKVVMFSPVHDCLPTADGYIIGGGYPELYARELEANQDMRDALRAASENGIPIYAECGGLMYLTDRIVLAAGWLGAAEEQRYAMCGVFSGETRMPARRVVSYVTGTSEADSPVGQAPFHGHEFHHSDVVLSDTTRYAYALSRGSGIRDNLDGAVIKNTLGSYSHLHPVGSRGMLRHFVGLCRKKISSVAF
jgi:cobyrinic acid a,c-diamide synthase